jgi:hypothetical protein
VTIGRKFAAGTVATSKYDERTNLFKKVNSKMEDRSNILPLDSFFGKKPDPAKDPYDRRKVL